MAGAFLHGPLSSEDGTCKKNKARFWLGHLGKSPELFNLRAEGVEHCAAALRAKKGKFKTF